jgi:predicted anti-sigma-YlaC factor YlaD
MTALLDCKTGVAALGDHLDGAVAPALRVRLTAHVKGCARCRAFVRSYRATAGIVRRASAAAPPPAMRRSLLRLLRRARD